MIADVVKPVRLHAAAGLHLPIVGRRIIQAGDHADHDIVDMGEVAVHVAVVEHRQAFAVQDLAGEDPQHHVGPPPRAIDGEEPQPGQRQAIEMGVSLAHQLIGPLGRGIKRNGVVGAILHRKGQLGIAAIDRRRAGIDHVFHLAVAGDFQQVQVPGKVRLHIGMGVFDRIAHPRLRAEVNDPIKPVRRQRGHQRGVIGKVLLDEGERRPRLARQEGQPVALQRNGVVVVAVIDPHNRIAARHQRTDQAETDEPGRAGNENFHAAVPSAAGLQTG